MKHDRTFEAVSVYGSLLWVATTLGRSVTWLRQHRAELEADGFPKEDVLTGLYLKADVLTWVRKRRRVAEPVGESRDTLHVRIAANPSGATEEDSDVPAI